MDEAVVEYHKASELPEHNLLVGRREELFAALGKRGKWDDVVAVCSKAVERDPHDGWALEALWPRWASRGSWTTRSPNTGKPSNATQ